MDLESLQTSFWVMVLIQTIGSVDMPGRGARKMPSPRDYVAIVVTWMVLMLISGISQQVQRATAAMGWLLVVAGMVLGPFGQRMVSFFKTVAQNFAIAPQTSTSGSSGPTGATTTPTSGRSVSV